MIDKYFDIEDTLSTFKVNGANYHNGINPTFSDPGLNLYLFTGSTSQYFANVRICGFQLYNGTTLVHHYIPCYRRSDMKPGMYDLISRTFLTNSGTGEFLLGPSITFGWGEVMNGVGGTYNLFKSFDGGKVTLVGTNGFDCVFNGEDHYTFLNMLTLLDGHLYTFSCDVSGLPSDGYIHFNLWNSESNYPWKLVNGHNTKTFLISSSKIPNYGANNYTLLNRMLFDDGSRSTTNGATISIRNMRIVYGPAENGIPALPHNISTGDGRNGEKNGSFNFTGNSYMNVDLPCTTNMTFALWFKPNSTSGTHVIDFRDSNSGYQPFYMSSDNSIQTGGSAGYPSINVTLSTSEWQHIAIVYTASNIKIYRNGVLAGTTTGGHGGEYGTKTLYIGCRYSQTKWLNGRIQDLQVWNEALDAAAIPSLM